MNNQKRKQLQRNVFLNIPIEKNFIWNSLKTRRRKV
jgi:hypothetical protein